MSNKSDWNCLRVLHNGRLVYQLTADGETFMLGQVADPEYGIPSIENGTDLTGTGRPDMIVRRSSGGAHCCLSVYVFELSPRFRLLERLEVANSDMSHFEKVSDGGYVFRTWENGFSYWPRSFAESPSAPVVLRYEPTAHRFGVDLHEMATAGPSDEEWNRWLTEARESLDSDGPKGAGLTLWSTVLKLIYSNHANCLAFLR